jgi:undecaprenyl phosphate-alpha-L-ara4N flippase subunit ArnE
MLKVGIRSSLAETVVSPPVIVGAVFYGAAFLLWLAALRGQPLSRLYPYLALNFVFVPVLAHITLREPIGGRQIIGYVCCIAGMLLAGR